LGLRGGRDEGRDIDIRIYDFQYLGYIGKVIKHLNIKKRRKGRKKKREKRRKGRRRGEGKKR
jgi:hypothetical protein